MQAKILFIFSSITYNNDNILLNSDKFRTIPYLNFNTPKEDGIWKSGLAASGMIQDDQITCSSCGP